MINKKYFAKIGITYLLVGSLGISAFSLIPTTYSDARKKDTIVEEPEENPEKTEENDVAEDISEENDSPKDDSLKDNSGNTNSNKKKKKNDNKYSNKQKNDEENTDLTEVNIPFSGTKVVADSLKGVKAIYRSGVSCSADGSDMTYSCAAFIKKYYEKNYGLILNNMYPGARPNVVNANDYFVTVQKPKVGDIVSLPGHWAIVKAVDGDQVILIEQNFKWVQGGSYYYRLNRHIPKTSGTYYRLHSLVKS